MAKEGLTTKQRLFVESYLSNGFNATEAARSAGYQGRDDHSLASIGYANLRKVEISAVVEERINEAAMSANEVLARLSRQARGSLADVLTEEGEFDLAEAKRRGVDDLLKKLKRTTFDTKDKDGNVTSTRTTHEFEIHDPQAALVHLGKYHKLFTDRTEVTGKDGGPIETSDASLTDEQRAGRIAAILDAARARRDGQASGS